MALRVYLYDADGHDREIELDTDSVRNPGPNSLVWVDVDSRSEEELERISGALELPPECVRGILEGSEPILENYGEFFHFAVEAAPQHLHSAEEDAERSDRDLDASLNHMRSAGSERIDFLAGPKWLVTVHNGAIHCLDRFRDQDKAETMIGLLTPQALAASLLDLHLGAFFEEVSRIEQAVDRIDERVLREQTSRHLLGRMVAMRRRVSRLRATLVRQRDIFYGLSRPDFALVADAGALPFYQALSGRFERALDEVERARDLVTGSFDLFTSRSSEQTNDLVKVLTFVTAIIGFCAAVAGLFGMNFDPELFDTGLTGFLAVTGSLLLIGVAAVIYARHRRWI